jgi:hypothetical protein
MEALSLLHADAADPSTNPNYWEELFLQGKSSKPNNPMEEPLDKGDATGEVVGSPIDIVSFDLDDTLWDGKELIKHANR